MQLETAHPDLDVDHHIRQESDTIRKGECKHVLKGYITKICLLV